MSRTVLIVDADHQARSHVAGILQCAGYRTECVGNLTTAARIVRERPPDLVITEIRLDGYNGLHLMATAERPLRAIVITSLTDPAIEVDARRFGADYLTKPVQTEALLTAVVRQLSRDLREALFVPARQWQRTVVRDIIVIDFDGRPARIRDVSDGGACLDVDHQRGPRLGPITVRRDGVDVRMYVAWERRLSRGHWLCGLQVASESVVRWRSVVTAIRDACTTSRTDREHVVSFFPLTRRLR